MALKLEDKWANHEDPIATDIWSGIQCIAMKFGTDIYDRTFLTTYHLPPIYMKSQTSDLKLCLCGLKAKNT